MSFSRREFIRSVGAAGALSVASFPFNANARTKAKVVVIGGGFGGATAAKYIRLMDPSIEVTLIERDKTYVSCPLSNEVIEGGRDIKTLTFSLKLAKYGVKTVYDDVTGVDAAKKRVTTKSGKSFAYDKLVMSPGVDFKWGAIEGYDQAAAEIMPHAYKAGPQTLLLRKQLEGLTDGENVIITVPPKPFRCPPGPYERASLIAFYMEHHKPKSKVIILDSNDSFSKKGLFEQGWKAKHAGKIEWVSGANDGKVIKVDTKAKKVFTNFGDHGAGVINVIPPHHAGEIAHKTGLVDSNGWCSVDPVSMESKQAKDIYVIGDACIAGELPVFDMPKSAHMASSHAKVAAAAIVATLTGKPLPEPIYINTCFSLITPDHGISVVHVYKVVDGQFKYMKDAGGVSPMDASPWTRAAEAKFCVSWFDNITADAFA